MDDIRHVMPVTFIDEEAMPDELFGRGNANGSPGKNSWTTVANPSFIDPRDAVSHPVDQIDEVLAHRRFGEPVWRFEPGDEAGGAKHRRGLDDCLWLEEQIEIFGFA